MCMLYVYPFKLISHYENYAAYENKNGNKEGLGSRKVLGKNNGGSCLIFAKF